MDSGKRRVGVRWLPGEAELCEGWAIGGHWATVLKLNGRLPFIIPDTYLFLNMYSRLRKVFFKIPKLIHYYVSVQKGLVM